MKMLTIVGVGLALLLSACGSPESGTSNSTNDKGAVAASGGDQKVNADKDKDAAGKAGEQAGEQAATDRDLTLTYFNIEG